MEEENPGEQDARVDDGENSTDFLPERKLCRHYPQELMVTRDSRDWSNSGDPKSGLSRPDMAGTEFAYICKTLIQ